MENRLVEQKNWHSQELQIVWQCERNYKMSILKISKALKEGEKYNESNTRLRKRNQQICNKIKGN